MLRSSPLSRLRLAFAPLIALAATFVAARADAAPTIGLSTNGTNPQRSITNNRPIDPNYYPNVVSYDDCIKDLSFDFSLILGGLPTPDILQVWAGTGDCSMTQNRSNAQSGTCQPVSAPVPMTNITTHVTVKARDLAFAAQSKPSPSNGGSAPLTSADVSVCDARTDSARATLTIVFIAFNGTQNDADATFTFNPTNAQLAMGVDTVGPAAPTVSPPGIGDTLMKLSWDPTVDPTDTMGFTVFCDPPPGAAADAAGPPLPDGAATAVCDASSTALDSSAPADSSAPVDANADAAVSDAAVSDAAVSDAAPVTTDASTPDSSASTCTPSTTSDGGAGGACYSPVIQPGINGTVIAAIQNGYYVCGGTSDKLSHEATITGLTNDISYTFGVAAKDAVGNVGKVAVFPCGTPQKIADFWHNYKDSGGGAGGSFCALDAVGMPVEAPLMAGTFVVAAVVLVRRRRSR